MAKDFEQLPAIYEQPPPGPLSIPQQQSFQPIEPESGAVPLSHYLWILRRQIWKILAFVMTCLVATYVISSRLQPIYEGTTTINVDRQAPSAVVGDDSKTGGGSQDPDQYLATQEKMIASDSVLRPVARRFDLLRREGQLENLPPKSVQVKESAPTSLHQLKVLRVPNTFLIRISYRSPDRNLSADVANAVAHSYLEHLFRLQIESSTSAANFMEKQLDELKAKMERSGQALGQFERELNVVNPEEKTSIISSRLLQLNTEYTNAQADRVKKEAIFNAMKTSGGVVAAQISGQGMDLEKIQDRINDAQAKFAEVKSSKGPNHPDYKRAVGQLSELLIQYNAAKENIGRRIELDYGQSVNREQILKRAVVETKEEFDKINARSFDYQRLKEEADADKKLYQELMTKIQESGINSGFQNRNIEISDEARPPSSPVFPNMRVNLLVAALISAFLGIAGVIILDTLDTSVRDQEQVPRLFQTELIGTIPLVRDGKGLLASEMPGVGNELAPLSLNGTGPQERSLSSYEEAIRMLRNSILLGDFDRHLRSILFTSATPGEGKTTTALHLALAHAAQGKKTLIIDADLRRPSLHRKLGVTAETGLSTVLTGDGDWRDALIQLVQSPNLDFLPSGPSSRRAADLVGSGIVDLLEQASRLYDLIIIDAPPLLGFAEPMQLAIAADGVVVVAIAGETHRKAIAAVVQTLKQLRANVLGIVLNRASKNTTGGYYYYQYGYNYSKYYGARKGEGDS